MATKKKATKSIAKTTTTDKKGSKTKPDASPAKAGETARRQALDHEMAGHWSQAAEEWASVERHATTNKAREEAAGRKAAAQVRARAKATAKTTPLEKALEKNPTAGSNAASWDSAMPEPGYVPPPGTGDEPDAATRDEAPVDEHGAETPAPKSAQPKEPPAPRERDPRLPPVGTVLTKRDRNGQERAHCTIVDGGVEYNGTTFKSISSAAIAAAKDLGLASKTQDGYAFWQLKKSAQREKDPIAALEHAWERYRERAAAVAKSTTGDGRAKIHDALNQHLTALNQLAAQVA